MAQNYIRQSTLSDGDTITASLFNDEYNQLVNAFTYSSTSASSTGHRHDGSAGQGGNIFKIGDLDFLNKIEVDSTNNRWGFYVEVSSAAVEQIRIQDGAIVPVTTNDIDLGTSSLQFKDLYIDGTANVDSLTLTSGSTVTTILDEDDLSSDSATALVTQQSVKAYIDAQVTAQDFDFQADSGGALSIDLDSETMTFTGGTGIDTSGSGNAVTFAIDSTVTTLTGTQTLTNKTLTTPVISTISNTGTLTLPTSTDTLVGRATTDTLTNKTLTSPDINTPDIDGGTIDGTVIGGTTAAAGSFTTVSATGNITVDGTVDGRDVATDGTKLDGIEAGATADQTAAEIRTLVESATDSNVFTDADHTKLDGIEANATADQTDAEIRAAVEAATDSNVFTDADHSKLDGIEASADVTDTANVTAAGALMDSELTSEASVKALNQGVATTDSPTFAGVTVNGTVEFDGLSGTGSVNVTDILDQDDMSSNSATALATQQSIKAYVDSQVATVDTLAEVLGNGNTTGGTDIAFGDNDKAIFGAGSDLQIYHDGDSSYISHNTTGTDFVIEATSPGDDVIVRAADDLNFRVNGNENGIVVVGGGATTLYNSNSAKLATTSTGIDVTGTVVADGLESSGGLSFTAADGIDISGKESVVVRIDSDDNDSGRVFQVISGPSASQEILIQAAEDAGVSLYYDNSAKFETTNTGIDVTGTVTADGLTVEANTATFSAGTSGDMELVIQADTDNNDEGDSPSLVFKQDGGNTIGRVGLIGNADDVFTGSLANALYIGNNEVANLQMYTDLKERLRIGSGGDISFYDEAGSNVKLLWDASEERLGLGTTSPNVNLDIESSSEAALDLHSTAGKVFRLRSTTSSEFIIRDSSAAVDRMIIESGGNVIFNESGTGSDFRVESDGNSHMLFVNAGLDQVAIGSGTISAPSGYHFFSYGAGSGARSAFVHGAGDGGIVVSGAAGGSAASVIFGNNWGTNGATFSEEWRLFMDGADDSLKFNYAANAATAMSLSSGGTMTYNFAAIFNESGGDNDFRVESDSNTHMLFVDAGNNRVAIGTSNPASVFTISDTDTTLAKLISTSTTAGDGARIKLTHNKTAADGDVAGYIDFNAYNDGGAEHLYGRIQVDATDVSASAEDGRLRLSTLVNGSTFEAMRITNGTVFNENGTDGDFRVESDSQSHMFFVDAGNGVIGVKNDSPVNAATHLSIGGDTISTTKATVSMVDSNPSLHMRGGSPLIYFDVTSGGVGTICTDGTKMEIKDGDIDARGNTTHIFGSANSGTTVINESSQDIDFRVESNNSVYGLYVDAAQDSVGILTNATDAALNVNSQSGSKDAIRIVGSGGNNFIAGYGNQGNLSFTISEVGADDPGVLTLYRDGTASHIIDTDENSETVFNEQGDNVDFRVESDSNAGMFFVDASANRIGVGTSSPDATLQVQTNHTSSDVTAANSNSTLNLGNAGSGNYVYNAIKFAGNQQDMYIMSFNNTTQANRRLGFFVGSVAGDAIDDERFIIKGDGDVAVINESAAPTNDVAHPGKLRIQGHGWNTNLGSRDQGWSLQVQGTYAQRVSGQVYPDLAFNALTTDTVYNNTAVAKFFYDGAGYKFQVDAGATFNESSLDSDFRVESDGDTHALFVNAGDDIVCFGTSSGTGVAVQNTDQAAQITVGGRIFTCSTDHHDFNRTNNGEVIRFRHSATQVGSISVTNSATAYNTSSDARLKENIADADDAGALIDAIQVRQFDWIVDGEHQRYGMVAQELNTVAPEAVSEGETEDDMMAVDYSKLVPMLVKEIQSLRARVAQLESN